MQNILQRHMERICLTVVISCSYETQALMMNVHSNTHTHAHIHSEIDPQTYTKQTHKELKLDMCWLKLVEI